MSVIMKGSVLTMKKTDLQWRLEASVLYETLRRQPHPHAARRVDLQERLPAVDVLGAIVWMRAKGTSIRVVWRPLDESVVLARSNKCPECEAEDPVEGVLVPFSPITGDLPSLTLLIGGMDAIDGVIGAILPPLPPE